MALTEKLLRSQLKNELTKQKDKRMFAPANAPQFTLVIPTVRNDFKVLAFEGTETISALYSISVDLVSEDPDIDLESLLNQPAFLQFGHNGEGIHGHIENVVAGESGKRLTHYHLTLVPALHYLKLSHNQRIFQNLTVPQIITQVLQQHGIQSDVFTFHVRTSVEREFCTQYGESDFEFVQRLCAEDGIAWHHQHSLENHLLVFTDDSVFLPALGTTPYRQDAGMVAEHPVVNRFAMGFSTRTSTVTRRDYDLKRPSLLLESRYTAEFNPTLEDYRYPLLMKTEKQGKHLVRLALERHRRDYQVVEGESNQPTLRSGYLFDLTKHPRTACNDMWLLVSLRHEGKQPQSLEEAFSSDDKSADGFTQGYRNSFSAIPSYVLYRPPLPPRKPVLVCQTARVTGPPGEEIFCDEYGRVCVEFPWDRAELNSEKSSCWLRVASSWAGEGFGAVTIPRVGMEVVVTFQEGDPDQPLITGCMANKVMSVAHQLPENKTKTVLRSQSSPRSGGYNELSIEDRAGREKIYLRAQRDIEQLILNDSHSLISNDRFEQVDNNSTSLIKGKEWHTTQGARSTVIGGDDLITISGNSSTTSAGSLVIQAGQQAHVTASNVVIDAGMSLTLTAGGHHIVINTGGIFSSVAIVEGGAPLAGIQPLQAVGSTPNAVIANPLSIVAGAHQQAVDYCPLCEACLDGQCNIGEAA
jgi:type VI secretion system secreted protein VgrG